MNINDIFENKPVDSWRSKGKERTYDVGITLNKKTTRGGFCIRFGFLNKAKSEFTKKAYLQISSVEKLQDKIYFRPSSEKEYLDCYKVSGVGNKKQGVYLTIVPSERAEKIYRTKWIGKTFNLKKDDDNGLYYIELSQ